MRARPAFRRLSVLALAAVACGEPRVKLDEAVVEERIGWIEESIPLCEGREVAAPTTRVVADEMRRLEDFRRSAALARRVVPLPSGGLRSAGSCGGDMSATYEHANGITDYVLTFAAFCMNTDEGPLTVDGVVNAREEGTPTANGPMIRALEVSSDGVVEVSQGGQTSELTITRVRTEYGNPNTFAPDPPDEQHPDVFTVGEISAVYPTSGGREDYIRNVRIERVGDNPATITILGGQLATTGEGRVDIRTAADDPVVVDIGGGDVVSGTVELVGSGGTVVAVSTSPTEAGVIQIELNGQPYTSDLDCTDGLEPVLEMGFALLSTLPIH